MEAVLTIHILRADCIVFVMSAIVNKLFLQSTYYARIASETWGIKSVTKIVLQPTYYARIASHRGTHIRHVNQSYNPHTTRGLHPQTQIIVKKTWAYNPHTPRGLHQHNAGSSYNPHTPRELHPLYLVVITVWTHNICNSRLCSYISYSISNKVLMDSYVHFGAKEAHFSKSFRFAPGGCCTTNQ